MATRSTIGVLNTDGSVTAVYCHWDGYPEHNGKILIENYVTEDKVRELVSMGGISSLGRQIGEQHPFSRWEDDQGQHPLVGAAKEARIELAEREGWTTFFDRDRGEKDVGPYMFANSTEFVHKFGEEYNYLFVGGTWFVNQYAQERNGQAVFDMVEYALQVRESEEV